MNFTRLAALLITLVATLILLAGCGGDDSGDKGERRDAGAGAEQDDDTGPDPEPADPTGRSSSESTFSLTAEIGRCMEEAGYSQDAPPTGGLAAWRHPGGARAVVASSDQASVTGGIAAEIGAQEPASVDGELVLAGQPAQVDAARACLR